MKRIDSNRRRSRAVIANGNINLGGQVANNWEGDIRQQTRETLQKIDELLAECGSDKSKMVSAVIWLKSMDDYAVMNEEWDAWIDPENPPTRACGEVRMADDALLVEILATAVV